MTCGAARSGLSRVRDLFLHGLSSCPAAVVPDVVYFLVFACWCVFVFMSDGRLPPAAVPVVAGVGVLPLRLQVPVCARPRGAAASGAPPQVQERGRVLPEAATGGGCSTCAVQGWDALHHLHLRCRGAKGLMPGVRFGCIELWPTAGHLGGPPRVHARDVRPATVCLYCAAAPISFIKAVFEAAPHPGPAVAQSHR